MHICMISTGYCPILPKRVGAIEPYVYELSKCLAVSNYVDVLGIGKGEEIKGSLHVLTFNYNPKIANSLSRFLGRRLAFQVPYNFFLVKTIFNLHKEKRIDMLHFHDANSGFAVAICKLLLGIPCVCSIHNEVKASFPINRCNRILAVSNYIQKFLVQKRRLNPDKVSVLNMALPYPPFEDFETVEQAKTKLGLKNHDVVLFVGRKCPEKGPQVLIDALKIVLARKPNLMAVFIGPDYHFSDNSENSYTRILQSKTQMFSIENNIIFKGFVSEEELKLYYISADLCVFPSIWNEPFGMVAIEALMYNKPTIASNVGGLPEIIADGQSGLLVEPNNPRKLAEAILRLLDNPKFSKSLGDQGRKNVEHRFTFEAVSARCMDIYLQILNKK